MDPISLLLPLLSVDEEFPLNAARALGGPLPHVHARDHPSSSSSSPSSSSPPPLPAPTCAPATPQPTSQHTQEEDAEMHERHGQEVADGGRGDGSGGTRPVHHLVDVVLSSHVGASAYVVDGGEERVDHPEEKRVDEVKEAGGSGGEEEVEEDVERVDGVEGHPHGPDLFVTCGEGRGFSRQVSWPGKHV